MPQQSGEEVDESPPSDSPKQERRGARLESRKELAESSDETEPYPAPSTASSTVRFRIQQRRLAQEDFDRKVSERRGEISSKATSSQKRARTPLPRTRKTKEKKEGDKESRQQRAEAHREREESHHKQRKQPRQREVREQVVFERMTKLDEDRTQKSKKPEATEKDKKKERREKMKSRKDQSSSSTERLMKDIKERRKQKAQQMSSSSPEEVRPPPPKNPRQEASSVQGQHPSSSSAGLPAPQMVPPQLETVKDPDIMRATTKALDVLQMTATLTTEELKFVIASANIQLAERESGSATL